MSTAGIGTAKAIEATAAAVYGPTPGRRISAPGLGGIVPLFFESTTRAASDRLSARRLYPSPAHARSTSAFDAAAKERMVGNRETKATKAGATRDAWVCWSITSLTRMLYGSGGLVRHG